jgi:hypothetical protein
MMISMAVAGWATEHYDPRTIGTVAGIMSCSTAVIWMIAGWRGMLKEPAALGIERVEVEVHGEPEI